MATVDESLLRRCCGELDRRIRQGEACRADEFFQRHPELRDSEASAIDLIYAEFVAREETGAKPATSEYLARYPQWSVPLSLQFEVHQSLDHAAEDSNRQQADAGSAAAERTVGNFELLERVAQGGTGVVYKARHTRLGHLVAVKMLLAGIHHDEQQRRRFLSEAATIARLKHPNIVRWYEFGTTGDGQLYLAMEWVAGGTLANRMTDELLPVREVAELMETVGRAVHYAHTQGVIHRDLKPGNILFDSENSPKVSDFGLAKSMELESSQTLTGEFIGTPRYAAPEQISQQGEIGAGADIYSLGVILYELLTGRPPILGDRAIETVQMALVVDPTSPRRLRPSIPKDLETICLHCLQKAPEKRYATAEQLADDLRRFRESEPIQARPSGPFERAWKWGKRRPTLAISLAVTLIALLTLSITTSFYSIHLQAAMQEAVERKHEADKNRQLVEEQLKLAQHTSYTLAVAQADTLRHRDPQRAAELLRDETRCPLALREFSWRLLDRLCHLERWTIDGHEHTVTALVISPDGSHLATASKDGSVKVWQLAAGELLDRLQLDAVVTDVAFSPEGSQIAATDEHGRVTFWRFAEQTSQHVQPGTHSVAATTVAFSPDGKRVASGGADGVVRLWDPSGAALASELPPHKAALTDLCFHSDGQQLVSADAAGNVRIWNLATAREINTFRAGREVIQIQLSPTGDRLACALMREGVAIFEMPSGKRLSQWSVPHHTIADVVFSATGEKLFTSGSDKSIRQWDISTEQVEATWQGHSDDIWTIDLGGPDNRWLATGGGQGQIKLWNVQPQWRNPRRLLVADGRVMSLAFTPDDQFLICGGLLGDIQIWNRESATSRTFAPFQVAEAADSATEFISLDISPDGSRVACTRYGGTLLVWDFKSRRTLYQQPQRWGARPRWSPDGSLLASFSRDGVAQVWRATDWTRIHRKSFDRGLRDVQFLAGNETLVAAADDGKVLLWNLQTDGVRTLDAHQNTTMCVSVSSDGATCATGSVDATIVLWDTHTWQRRATLKGHSHTVWSLAFTADGRTLASGTGMLGELLPGEVKLWDTSTGHCLVTLEGMAGPVAFVDGDKALVTAGEDDAVWLWSADAR